MFKYNEEIEVRDCDEGLWGKYFFRTFLDNKYYVAPDERDHHPLIPWNQARAIPKRIPHTLETFPKGNVLMRGTKTQYSDAIYLVTQWGAKYVTVGGRTQEYKSLADYCAELSTDNGKTWVPAHQDAEPTSPETIDPDLWFVKVRKPGGSTPDHMLYHWRIISAANPNVLFKSDEGYRNRAKAIAEAEIMAGALHLNITEVTG